MDDVVLPSCWHQLAKLGKGRIMRFHEPHKSLSRQFLSELQFTRH